MKVTSVLFALASPLTVTLGSALPQTTAATDVVAGVEVGLACKEGNLQCGDTGLDGSVFACRNNAWDVLMRCRSYESCISDPFPTCGSASGGTDAVNGFENTLNEVPASNNKGPAINVPEGVTAAVSPYYNICSPCIRFFDRCQQSCGWQGKGCDTICNWRTCSINLTTGDFRQATVSCGRFCKWPCPQTS